MARLPEPGKDIGTWGIILNDFLNQSHNADGSIKDNAVTVDLSGKVDKVTGKSLISDTDITRLEGTSGANTGDQDLSGKVDINTAIAGATKTKISYDAKGLVTAGVDATTEDIASITDKRYSTDAQLAAIAANTAQLADIANQISQLEYGEYALMESINPLAGAPTAGKYLDATGIERSNAALSYTNYISVVAGVDYLLFAMDASNISNTLLGCYYNSEKTFIGAITGTYTALQWTAPINTAYIRLNYATANSAKMFVRYPGSRSFAQSIWYGKKVNFLGTSITNGYTVLHSENYFINIVNGVLGFSVVRNYGQNGTRMANNVTSSGADDATCFARRYTAMDADADLIIVEGTTNDYGSTNANGLHTAPIGTMDNRTDATFYGALHVLFAGLLNRYPRKQIVMMTNTHRTAIGSATLPDTTVNPDTSKGLNDYVAIVKEVCAFYGISVCDLYNQLTIAPHIAYHYFMYMADGVHPNIEGHRLIANALINFLRKL